MSIVQLRRVRVLVLELREANVEGLKFVDAVDKEVVKRFRILIETSADEITKASLSQVLSRYHDVNISSYHESIQPYIKHYIYMVKREENR